MKSIEIKHLLDSDAQKLETLLNQGLDIDRADDKGKTLLIWATQKNRSDIVKLLLENNAQLDMTDMDGKSALMWAAAKKKDASIFKLLLDAGADYTLRNRYRRNAFYIAVQSSNVEIVELLISAGAFKCEPEWSYYEIIELAARKGNLSILEMLLEKDKALHNDHAKGPYFVLNSASENGNEDVVRSVLNRVETVDVMLDGRTPLMRAVSGRHWSIVQLLIGEGASVDIEGGLYGQTALFDAARQYDNTGLRILLSQQANVNCQDSDGLTALMCAAKLGLDRSIRLLIEAGADGNIQDNNGYTALMWAARKDEEVAMATLLELGVDPNIKDKHGDSAVFIAIEDRRFFTTYLDRLADQHYDLDGNLARIVKMFLDAGIDLQAKDRDGDDLRTVAKMRNLSKVLKLLGS